MALQLSQVEIDALLVAVRNDPGAPRNQEPKKAKRYDFQQSKSTGSDQFSIVKEILQAFARDFGSAAGDYLRTTSEVKIISMEQTLYREFVSAVPETAQLSSFSVLPADATFLFQADLSVVYPMIDLVLGGPGTGIGEARPLTSIEEQVFETILNLICASLKKACSQVPHLDIRSDGTRKKNELPSLLPATETILTANFEVHLGEAQGNFHFALPSAAFDSLIQTVTLKARPEKRIPSTDFREKLRKSLLETRFSGQLVLPPSLVMVRELLALEPGRVLVLPKRALDPANLQVAGRPAFVAYPVRLGQQRGARVERRSPVERKSDD